VIQLSNPQTTHARAKAFQLSSDITTSVDLSSWTFQKRSVNFSPSSASLTMIFHVILSASKV
jgi:hypothetical protein